MAKGSKQSKDRSLLKVFYVAAGLLLLGLVIAFLLKDTNVALFNPKGQVARDQLWLMTTSTLVILAFGLPVVLTLYFIAWKYRESNQQDSPAPAAKNSKAFLVFAWGAPMATAIVLAVLMLPATQRLQPQSTINADKEQMTVQVVALRWKWLFIYPKDNIATVNFVQIPVDTPVRFELTADGAPMNAFWVPNLGGMLYAMTGHVNPLNLIGNTVGDYPGSSAEINGTGFAGMKFTARVSSQQDFNAWIAETKASPVSLDESEYQKLLEPSKENQPAFYANPSPDLYSVIINKYSGGNQHGGNHAGNEG